MCADTNKEAKFPAKVVRRFLCGSLRLSAFSALTSISTQRAAEIRRGPQRYAEGRRDTQRAAEIRRGPQRYAEGRRDTQRAAEDAEDRRDM
jgi:hypothetical protein